MQKYLYDCEITNNTLFLKFALISNETLRTEVHSIQDLVNGTVSAANVTVTPSAVIVDGKKATSAKELMDVIKKRDNIIVGTSTNGSVLMIDRKGQLVTIPPVAAVENNTNDSKLDTKQIIDQLVEKLNIARDSYYNKSQSLISDKVYDELYDKLEQLEKQTGYVRPDSPTQNVGAGRNKVEQPENETQATGTGLPDYSKYKQGDKVELADAALSLDKTKDVTVLENLLNNGDGILSIKMDGLTLMLTYMNGELVFASTRGNGFIGEFCLENAKNIIGVPSTISYKGLLTVRGEAHMLYTDFNAINSQLQEDDKYKNPRNLASGTVRTFNRPDIVRQRRIRFAAFEIVNWKDLNLTTFKGQLDFLKELGFTDVIKHILVTKNNVANTVSTLTATVKASSIPADGLVLRLNDLLLGERLGIATKFPRHSIAFKWEDAEIETKLKNIEWQVGRTGRITPIAVFNPVDIEGSTVQKASIHNLSMLEDLLGRPYVGQTVWVYKANLIIPQVARGDKDTAVNTSALIKIPDRCPCCGSEVTMNIDTSSGVRTLWCLDKNCPAKGLQQWAHFVERDAMNVNGLGEAVLQDLLDLGIINNNLSSLYTATPYDYFRLCTELEGYGEKKVTNILDAIEKSKTIALENVLYAYGIPNIGLQTAKQIVKLADYDLDKLSSPNMLNAILSTNGLGQVVANSWKQFMMSDRAEDFFSLCDILHIKQPKAQTAELSGLTFCCTGDVYQYKNRKELQASIEQRGGKFTTSVTGNTDYLITNDTESGSAKNKAAKAKGIPVITEQQFIDQFGK